MSKTRQISVTLPEHLIDAIKHAVDRGEARSVSSYIASHLEPGFVLEQIFAEWDAERGAPSADDYAWADRELDRTLGAAHADGAA